MRSALLRPHGAAAPPRRAATVTTPAGGAPTLEGFPAFAAQARHDAVTVRVAPDAAAPVETTLPPTDENGAPQTFLIKGEQDSPQVWYHVLLPVRPNGTTGWVAASDVDVFGVTYRLVVHLASFKLDVFKDDRLARTIPIGVGTDQTPTPGGEYYIKELLEPPDQNTVYGHHVFGLSGFSNVLVNWPGGGVLGLHGTNDPDHSIGKRVSHGCVRMRNADIDYLAGVLPLGTPVEIAND